MNLFASWRTYKKPKPAQVKCETCKHWVDKADCQEVRDYDGGLSQFYCPIHRKPYDLISFGGWSQEMYKGVLWVKGRTKFYKTIPAHEVEVDEEGREITKKK